MPRFMVPRFYEIKNALPYTPTNKVKKADLRSEGTAAAVWDRMAGRAASKHSQKTDKQGVSNVQ